jgi:hypothetical protein
MSGYDPYNNDGFSVNLESKESSSSSSGAKFSLAKAPEKVSDLRMDEQIQLELTLHNEVAMHNAHASAVCCGIATLPWAVFCCLPQLTVVVPMWQSGNLLMHSRIFLTEKAVYFQVTDEGREATGCCVCRPMVNNVRCPYEMIAQVTSGAAAAGCCGNLCCHQEGGTAIAIRSTQTRVEGTGKHRRTVDDFGFTHPNVDRGGDVARLLLFLCDRARENEPVDWQSVKNEFNL